MNVLLFFAFLLSSVAHTEEIELEPVCDREYAEEYMKKLRGCLSIESLLGKEHPTVTLTCDAVDGNDLLTVAVPTVYYQKHLDVFDKEKNTVLCKDDLFVILRPKN